MRRRPAAAALALCIGTLTGGLLAGPGTARADSQRPTGDGQGTSYHTIVSAPDFFNADVGDVSVLPSWDGRHNSFNRYYRRAVDVVLGQFASEQPDSVLVAGDLVEGHWGVDADRTGIFGPVDTEQARRAAVRRAGSFYYRFWKKLFTSRGMPLPHVAVGDHEIGDNAWPAGSFKHRAVPVFKDTFADALIGSRYPASRRPTGTPYARTSYWTALHPEVMLVSVDVFKRTASNTGPSGGVVADVEGRHLAWFRRVLAHGRANFDWIIVQAHTPILGPVRVAASSGLFLEKGPRSAMWRAMRDHDVDLYLAGEVHAVTAIDPAHGPVQITHGGLFAYGGSRYLRLDVSADRIDMHTHDFVSSRDKSKRLWQTSTKRPPYRVTYEPNPPVSGTAVLTKDGALLDRTGDLAPAGLSAGR